MTIINGCFITTFQCFLTESNADEIDHFTHTVLHYWHTVSFSHCLWTM